MSIETWIGSFRLSFPFDVPAAAEWTSSVEVVAARSAAALTTPAPDSSAFVASFFATFRPSLPVMPVGLNSSGVAFLAASGCSAASAVGFLAAAGRFGVFSVAFFAAAGRRSLPFERGVVDLPLAVERDFDVVADLPFAFVLARDLDAVPDLLFAVARDFAAVDFPVPPDFVDRLFPPDFVDRFDVPRDCLDAV